MFWSIIITVYMLKNKTENPEFLESKNAGFQKKGG